MFAHLAQVQPSVFMSSTYRLNMGSSSKSRGNNLFLCTRFRSASFSVLDADISCSSLASAQSGPLSVHAFAITRLVEASLIELLLSQYKPLSSASSAALCDPDASDPQIVRQTYCVMLGIPFEMSSDVSSLRLICLP